MMVDAMKESCNTPDQNGETKPFITEEIAKKAPKKEKKPIDWQKVCMAIIFVGMACVFMYLFVSPYFAQNLKVEGPSMENTYHEGDIIKVNKKFDKLTKGDIVVFERKNEQGKKIKVVKRIIGLPTQRVRITDGVAFVDGVAIDEPYAINKTNCDSEEVTLTGEEFFVLGDNRAHSFDSSEYGGINFKDIIGKVKIGKK